MFIITNSLMFVTNIVHTTTKRREVEGLYACTTTLLRTRKIKGKTVLLL